MRVPTALLLTSCPFCFPETPGSGMALVGGCQGLRAQGMLKGGGEWYLDGGDTRLRRIPTPLPGHHASEGKVAPRPVVGARAPWVERSYLLVRQEEVLQTV